MIFNMLGFRIKFPFPFFFLNEKIKYSLAIKYELYNSEVFFVSCFVLKQEHESEGGRTPLMKAARAGHVCTVQFLISKGNLIEKFFFFFLTIYPELC